MMSIKYETNPAFLLETKLTICLYKYIIAYALYIVLIFIVCA